MKNYHSLLLTKVAVCFLLAASPSQAANPQEVDLSKVSDLAATETRFNLEDKLVDKAQEFAKSAIAEEVPPELKAGLSATVAVDSIVSSSDKLEKKSQALPKAEIPKIAQVFGQPPINPPVGMPSSPNGVMVPNPEIIIRSNGTPNPTILQPTMPMAPTLPRAVAPPVGDMSISNVNSRYDPIDLGPAGQAIIPRLVLRRAPADEVLKVLARYAGVNVVVIDGDGAADAPPAAAAMASGSQLVSLDIQNEPVQNVFNSVIIASGLKASRNGSTIFVGKTLPQEARNTITRTIRLNQVQAFDAATFLSTQGAQTYAYRQSETVATEVGEDKVTRTVTQKTPTIENIELSEARRKFSPLNGLTVSADERLNSVTLVGEPRLITLATTLLTQLDARRRQVAVNVKIVDIDLNNVQDYNSSFSFGIGDSYFVQDQGTAVMRFGSTAPATEANINSATGRLGNPPAIVNPFGPLGANPSQVFFDPNQTTNLFVPVGNQVLNLPFLATGQAAVSGNPFNSGITQTAIGTFTPPTATTPAVITATPPVLNLPSYFQYPKKFQAQVDAQIRSGNAKILTDPTLVVQEGQKAEVKLTQSVISSINTQVDPLSGVRTTTPVLEDVGLTLAVVVNRIDDNGFISLEAVPIVAAPAGQERFESGPGANNTITLINKRTLASGQLRLRDGQTLILTGIISESQQSIATKVPILGDIPILGALFRSQSDQTNRSEVVIMVTPQILHDNSEAQFGYNYTPGPATAGYLRQQGFPVQAQP
ncbi:MAG: secretin N-terminal domain-containing protein [Snowella sp.]|nr:secretin N-terminal domain-containing protein [Snowella sp.]